MQVCRASQEPARIPRVPVSTTRVRAGMQAVLKGAIVTSYGTSPAHLPRLRRALLPAATYCEITGGLAPCYVCLDRSPHATLPCPASRAPPFARRPFCMHPPEPLHSWHHDGRYMYITALRLSRAHA